MAAAALKGRARPGAEEAAALMQRVQRSDGSLLWAMVGKLWYIWSQSGWLGFICELLSFLLIAVLACGSPRAFPDRLPVAAHLRVSVSIIYLATAFQRTQGRASFDVVFDKTSKLRIYQEVNGLPPHVYWQSWWLYHSALGAGYALLIVMVSHGVPYLFRYSNPVLLWLVLTLAYVQHCVVGWFWGVFLDKFEQLGNTGWLSTIMVALASGFNIVCNDAGLGCAAQLLPLFSVVGTLASVQWLEVAHIGFTWESFFANCCTPGRPEQGGVFIPAGVGLIFMVVTTVLYATFVYWFDQVTEGMWGLARPWDFLWRSPSRRPTPKLADQLTAYGGTEAEGGRPPALVVSELVKVYGEDGRPAVDSLSLEIHDSEIFALLGHNGSGKTTMIHCAVGMVAPTSGDVHVNGVSIREDAVEAQRQLALCPQESPVFAEFSVQRHLTFFGTLRGASAQQLEGQVTHVLKLLDLGDKREHLGNSLSGGQKRRLWVATALLGAAPVIFLDEPSSGMDPASRHKLWEALAWMRNGGRAVVFTTHYLEEADIMADRKAILAEGRTKAVGTSLELKKRYAVGYRLRVELAPGTGDPGALRALVLRRVAAATEPSELPPQAADEAQAVEFLLPFGDADLFGPLLEELDERGRELGVQDYGLQVSSLEDVYMKLAPDLGAGGVDGPAAGSLGARGAEPLDDDLEHGAQGRREHRRATIRTQLVALMLLRVKIILDNGHWTILLKIVVPVVLFNLYMVKHRDNVSPGGWYSVACGFPLSLVTITGPTLRELSQDLHFRRKFLMIAQGMAPWAYWCGGLVVDYIMLLPVTLAVPLFAWLFRMPYLSGPGLGMVLAEAFLYPIHLVVYMYTIQSLLTVGESRIDTFNQTLMCLGTCAGATLPAMVTWGLLVTAFGDYPHHIHMLKAAYKAHALFSAFLPPYSMPGVMLMVLLESFMATKGHAERPVPMQPGDFFHSRAGLPFFLPCFTTGILALRLIWRKSGAARLEGASSRVEEKAPPCEDPGVVAEEERLRQGPENGGESVIAYRDLRYTYEGEAAGPVRAVRGVSLGLKRGECFGLLGPNGAGKTTTLGCLTGELWPPTAGGVFVDGRDLAVEGFAALYGQLGMCLQEDTHLWAALTGFDHLFFYARVKGVPEAELEWAVDAALECVELRGEDASRPTFQYSGGMRRRLSVAIALLNQSPILFMDEPTAAVDVMVKRQLWRAIRSRGADQTVLLTSHHMEEVEALCDRVAIQVLGRLRALGTPTHLRHRYGSGYQLELLVAQEAGEAEVAALEAFVRERISGQAKLVDSQPGRLVFQLKLEAEGQRLRLSAVFSEVSRAKAQLGIADYSLRQPTLEQVFIRFAHEQAAAGPRGRGG